MHLEYLDKLPCESLLLDDPTLYPYACMHEDIHLYLNQLEVFEDIKIVDQYNVVYDNSRGHLYIYLDNGDCIKVTFK